MLKQLMDAFDYCPQTGVFTRKSDGSRADKDHGLGYHRISFKGEKFYAHRIAWLFVHGSLPTHGIDHVNGDKADNRIANLRDVPQSVNVQNCRKSKRGGLLGVAKSRDRFKAEIRIEGKKRHLGVFPTAELAHAAYMNAKRDYHAGCAF